MAENHKILVQDLKLLSLSLSSLQEGPWRLSGESLEEIEEEVKEFSQLSDKIRELEEKSQGIIQLVRLIHYLKSHLANI